VTRPPGFVCVVGEVLEVGDESRTLVVVRGLVGEVLQIDDESKIMIVSFTALSAAVFCRFCSPLVCLSAAPSLSYSPQFLGGSSRTNKRGGCTCLSESVFGQARTTGQRAYYSLSLQRSRPLVAVRTSLDNDVVVFVAVLLLHGACPNGFSDNETRLL
jgi:hypothetical protein